MASLDYTYIAHLVRRSQCGDNDAFAELYAATYQKEYQFAYQYLKNEQDAQDALQETYILAIKNLSQLKDPTLVVAWLNQINFRVCYSMVQKQARQNNEDIYANELEAKLPRAQNPEEQVILVDSKQYIMQQILKLPYTESQVILLKYYKSLPLDDIAYIMDLSRSTIKRYLKSGKARLKGLLQQD